MLDTVETGDGFKGILTFILNVFSPFTSPLHPNRKVGPQNGINLSQ